MQTQYKIIVNVIHNNFYNKVAEFIAFSIEECIGIVNTQKAIIKQDYNDKIDISVLNNFNELCFHSIV